MKKLICLLVVMLTLCSCNLMDNVQFGDGYIPPQGTSLRLMPDKSSIGANTFGCYVDKKVVAVKGRYQVEGISCENDNGTEQLHSLVNGFFGRNYIATASEKDVMSLDFFIMNCRIQFIFDTLFVGKNKCSFSYYNSIQGGGFKALYRWT